MKTHIKILFLLVTYGSLTVFEVQAQQWQQANGPYGGRINAIAINSTNSVFAGTKGLYKTIDSGNNWIDQSNVLFETKSISIYQNKIVTGGGYGGVLLSTDNGLNWSSIGTGITGNIFSTGINNHNIFIGTSNRIWLSQNNGQTWQQITNGIPEFNIYDALTVQDSLLYTGCLYNSGVYKSSNNGLSWKKINYGLKDSSIYSLLIKDSLVFCSTDSGVFVSNIHDTTWSYNSFAGFDVRTLAKNGNTMYASTFGNGVFKSDDNGATWQSISGDLADLYVISLAVNNNMLCAGTYGSGVFISIDNGLTWLRKNNGIRALDVSGITKSGSRLFLGTKCGSVFSSEDNGLNWQPLQTRPSFMEANCILVNGQDILVGYYPLDGNYGTSNLYLSSNDGINWDERNNGIPLYNNSINAITMKNSVLYAATSKGIYKSIDNGLTWSSTSNNGPCYSLLAVGDTLYGGFGHLRFTADNGTTWEDFFTGMEYANPWNIYKNGNDLFTTNFSALYKRSSGSNQWVPLIIDTDTRAIAINGLNIYIGVGSGGLPPQTYTQGVLLSTDYGASWAYMNNGLPANEAVYSLTISGNYLIAGTENSGIWRYEITTDVEEQSMGADVFIYPNPVNEKLHIEIPGAINASISLQSITGIEIINLSVNKNCELDISKVKPGIYFLNVNYGRKVFTKKIVKSNN